MIFFVEDDIDHAELITTFLRLGGIDENIVWFRDAESIIENISKLDDRIGNLPRLIIIDLKLPRMDGFTLISSIRSIDKMHNIPIIVLSSSSQPSDISKALELGAEEFINKLTEMEDLASKVKKHLT